MRVCSECGTDISKRHGNSKRCVACSTVVSAITTGVGTRTAPCSEDGNGQCKPGRLKRGLCDRHYRVLHRKSIKDNSLHTINCVVCDKQVETRNPRRVTCSIACRSWRVTHPGELAPQVGRNCLTCGEAIPEEIRAATFYCSIKCRSAASKRRVRKNVKPYVQYITCAHCGGPLISKRAGVKYCSEKCGMGELNHPGSFKRRNNPGLCEQCGSAIPVEGRIGRRFCSNDCTVRSNQSVRRARRKGLPAEKFSRFEIFERDGWMCHICREAVQRDLSAYGPQSPTMDHLIPLSHPATPGHVKTNVALAHRRCNIGKNGRVRPRDFGLRIELLIKEVERLGAERRLAL